MRSEDDTHTHIGSPMKKRDLERQLISHGYRLVRYSRHPVYENAEGKHIALPHGNEINKMLAKKILKQIGEVR